MKEFNIIFRRLPASIAVAMLIALVACTLMPTPAPTPETMAKPPAPDETPASEPVSKPTPAELVPRISIEELLEKMEDNANIVVVDARPKAEYDAGHIKGAMSAPLAVILEGHWAPPPEKEVIFY